MASAIPRRLLAAPLLLVVSACAGDDAATSEDPTITSATSAASTTGDETWGASTAATATATTATTSTSTTATSSDTSSATTDATTTNTTSTSNTTTDATTDATTGVDPGDDPDPNAPPIVDGPWWRPTLTTSWQLQLTEDPNTRYDVDLYDLDLFDTPAPTIAALQAQGRRVICYFSAGSAEDWRPDFADFDAAALGDPLDGWPGERWLDITEPSVIAVMRGRLDLAVAKGCDGVDPDNVDGYTQASGFTLTETDQRAYNRWLANQAHKRGLTVGLKNGLDQVAALVDYFDFDLNEQCHEYDECALLQPFLDQQKPAFNVEYPGDEGDAQALAPMLCKQAEAEGLRTLMLPLELDGTWRVSCD